MFKKIPGSTDYSINLKGEVRDFYGKPVTLKKGTKGKILIELFGKEKEMSLIILTLLAWYEVGDMDKTGEHLNKIVFHQILDNSLRLRSKFLMSFTEPIYYRDGFRYIPNYPRYAINKDAEIIDTSTNRLVTKIMMDVRTDGSTGDNYMSAYIRTPERNANRYTRIHRLLALAWIPNDDFVNRPFINHLDGVRSNNELSNLEWCNLQENARHALDTGLNDTQVKMKTRDSTTGEIRIHNSVTDLGKFLGFNLLTAARFDRTLPGYRYADRYEIKRYEDNTPWYYDNDIVNDHTNSKSIYVIKVTDKRTGEVRSFNNVTFFYNTYNHRPIAGGIEPNMVAIRETRSDLDISYSRNALKGPYRIVDLTNDSTVFVLSIPEITEVTGINRNEIRYDLTSGAKFIYANRWIISTTPPSQIFDKSEYVNKLAPAKPLTVTNVTTGVEVEMASIREAESYTGITRRTINKLLLSGKTFKNWIFRPLD